MERVSTAKVYRFTFLLLIVVSSISSLIYALRTRHEFFVKTNRLKQDELERKTHRSSLPWYMDNYGYRPNSTTSQHHSQTRLTTDAEIWPGPERGDRIERQLMISPIEGQADGPLKTIYLQGRLSNWQLSESDSGQHLFTRQRCPVDRCNLTDSSNEVGRADAVLIKDVDWLNYNHHRLANQIWIMYTLESSLSLSIPQEANDKINWTATYRHDSELTAPYEKWIYFDNTQQQMVQTRNYAENKMKKVAWMVSNCGSSNKRMEYAEALAKYIDVDIYGYCGRKKCSRGKTKECIKDYKFYLAFENSNCREYITEKFYSNGLGSDVLPIVMGAPRQDYEDMAPYNSFIHVDDFASPKELAHYLHLLDKDDLLYNKYFQWKGTGVFINTYFYCRLCAMLHEADRAPPHVYRHLRDWWLHQQCTKHPWPQENFQTAEKKLKKKITNSNPTDNGDRNLL